MERSIAIVLHVSLYTRQRRDLRGRRRRRGDHIMTMARFTIYVIGFKVVNSSRHWHGSHWGPRIMLTIEPLYYELRTPTVPVWE